ncbi:MAG: right-handed parallel beta-helix repeat-containing protein [Oceanipulchritudo sp.]
MDPVLTYHPTTAEELNGALKSLAEARGTGDTRPAEIQLPPHPLDLEGPLMLGPKHSHLTFTTENPGKSALRSLRALRDFKETTLNNRTVWHLHLPEVQSGARHPRTLFVNGAPRPRARYPKFDPQENPEAMLKAVPYEEGQVPVLHWGTHRIPTQPGDIDPSWENLYDAELVGMHFWTEERLPNLHFNAESNQLTSSFRTAYRLTEGTKPLPFRYFIENLLDALTEPGEWCLLETTGDLYYFPKEGEILEDTVVEIPLLATLVKIQGGGYGSSKDAGDPTTADWVSSITFDGITFSHSDWLPIMGRNLSVDHKVPKTGRPMGASTQAAIDGVGAIDITYARDIRFSNCRFEHLRGHAVRVNEGCGDVQIDNSVFRDLGGSALLAHGADVDGPPAGRTRNIYFLNNDCERLGRVFFSSCGVLGGAVHRMVIAHNRIHDLFYSGISLGWTWGYAETVSSEHVVEYNDIRDVSQGLLNDLGGVYLVGRNTGSVIRRNKVVNVKDCNFGAKSIYLDEGCCHILVEQNLCIGASEANFNMHYGQGHVLRHNIFIDGGHAGIRASRDDGGCLFSAYQNILLSSESAYRAGYALANLAHSSAKADFNLIWPGNEKEAELLHPPYLGHERVPFADWQAAGNDRNAVFADPLFIDAASGDYRLQPDSPAHKLGFREWDHARAGPVDPDTLPDYRSSTGHRPAEF